MIDKIVETYIELRDRKAQMEAAHKAALAPINQAMLEAEMHLLTEMDKLGTEAFKTPAGTAYKSTRTSATVADWDSFIDFVRNHALWNMLERRVSKSAVDEYAEEKNDLPPGVNYRREVTVNIRRN